MGIKKLTFINNKKGRRIEVTTTDGHKVKIEPLYDGYEQYGAPIPVLTETVDIARRYNGWLHGGSLPGLDVDW